TTTTVWLTQLCANHFHPCDLAMFTDDFDRLTVELKFHPFFTRILYFTARTRHVFFITAICTSDCLSTLTNRSPVTIHRCITTAQHNDFFALYTDVFRWLFFPALGTVDIGNQEIQRV